jgi:hypothetical protein
VNVVACRVGMILPIFLVWTLASGYGHFISLDFPQGLREFIDATKFCLISSIFCTTRATEMNNSRVISRYVLTMCLLCCYCCQSFDNRKVHFYVGPDDQ